MDAPSRDGATAQCLLALSSLAAFFLLRTTKSFSCMPLMPGPAGKSTAPQRTASRVLSRARLPKTHVLGQPPRPAPHASGGAKGASTDLHLGCLSRPPRRQCLRTVARRSRRRRKDQDDPWREAAVGHSTPRPPLFRSRSSDQRCWAVVQRVWGALPRRLVGRMNLSHKDRRRV